MIGARVRMSARQHLRQAMRKNQGQSRRHVSITTTEELLTTQSKKNPFGRVKFDVMPKTAAIGAMNLLDVGVLDALKLTLDALTEEDDDGR